MKQDLPKIICIGFHKTGTTSLSHALEKLGVPVAHGSDVFQKVTGGVYQRKLMGHVYQDKPFRGELFEALCEAIDQTHGIQDSPSVCFYKEFAARYPDAKFIFTTREETDWIISLKNFVRDKSNALRRYMYGIKTISGNENRLLEVYRNYHTDIRNYFAGNPNFKEFDIGKGELNWENLTSFLGEAYLPDEEHRAFLNEPFPRSNVNVHKTV